MATKQKAQDEPKAPASSDDSAYLHTYLVRVGLLARGMLLRGRITTFNHMVNEVKKDCPVEEIQASIIKDIHPAMPSSEIQFWLLSDASRQLESSFSVMFLELLSGLPIKSVEVVRYIVNPGSVLPAYIHYVQHNPSHTVYKVTLSSTEWVLDPGGARMGYEEILLPWKVFKSWKCQELRGITTLEPDIASYERAMGICNHGLALDKKAESKDEGSVEEDPIERLFLRMWVSSWASLLSELFGGSMTNIGSMDHGSFCVAMDEFLAIVEAYVGAYLLDSPYYKSLKRDQAHCLSWATKMYDGHPASGYIGCLKGCPEWACICEGMHDHAMRQAGPSFEIRWVYRDRVKAMTGHDPENLSKEELLKTVEKLLIDRARVKMCDS